MDRVNTYSVNAVITSSQMNSIQDRAVGGEPSAVGNLTGLSAGERVVWFESAVDLANAKVMVVDERNWKDHVVAWTLNIHSAADQEIGGVNDIAWDQAVTSGVAYLGLGALDGASAQVTDGNPPVRATVSSWAGDLGGGKWLYVDSFDGYKLKFYNNTGSTLKTPALRVAGTKTNKR